LYDIQKLPLSSIKLFEFEFTSGILNLTLIFTASKPQPNSLLQAEKGGGAFSTALKICSV
jgi:hypothetical protein